MPDFHWYSSQILVKSDYISRRLNRTLYQPSPRKDLRPQLQSYSTTMSAMLTLVIATFLAYMFRKLMTRREQRHFPPGPRGLPFLGNAFDFPTANIGSEYVQWGEKYNSWYIITYRQQGDLTINDSYLIGDILHASAFGTHVVIINSQQIADELLERRGAKYSDRPYFPTIDL